MYTKKFVLSQAKNKLFALIIIIYPLFQPFPSIVPLKVYQKKTLLQQEVNFQQNHLDS